MNNSKTNDFPIPQPDRRKSRQSSSKSNSSSSNKYDNFQNLSTTTPVNPFIPSQNLKSFKQQFPYTAFNNPGTNDTNNNPNNITSDNLTPGQMSNSMSLVKLKMIQDMRNKIHSFKVLSGKDMFLPNSFNTNINNKCSIILFGPSGSGKSSFIRSMYRALFNNNILPPEVMSKLVIKHSYQNEGTLCFTRLFLQEETQTSSGIILCDTRGQIRMNESEKEQFKILIDGKVKEGVVVEQRADRDPFSLWEFWKKDSELFPPEILCATEVGLDSIPHCVVLVFDGSKDDVIEKEDEQFYRDLVTISRRKGYLDIHVVLTRIDMFEKIINERHKNLPLTERTAKLNTIKDEKIEKVIEILGVNRSNIHFIENYHSEDVKENILEIDYHLLKTLCDLVNACEQFMINYLNRTETCFASCFPRK